MDKEREEKLLRWMIRILVLTFVAILVLGFGFKQIVPGLVPALFCLIWILQWRLFYIRGLFPGRIYTFLYLLIAILSLVIAISQIREVLP